MKAFDRLPARLRRVLNYAPIELAPTSILAHLRRGVSPLRLVTSIKAMSADAFSDLRAFMQERRS